MGAAAATSMLAARDATMVVPAVAAVARDAPQGRGGRRRGAGERGGPSPRPTAHLDRRRPRRRPGLVGVLAYRGLSGASTISPDRRRARPHTRDGDRCTSSGPQRSAPINVLNAPPPGTRVRERPGSRHPGQPATPSPSSTPCQPVPVTVPPCRTALTAALDRARRGEARATRSCTRRRGRRRSCRAPSSRRAAAPAPLSRGHVVQLTLLAGGRDFPMPERVRRLADRRGPALGQYGLNAGTQSLGVLEPRPRDLVSATSPAAGTHVTAGPTSTSRSRRGRCPVTVPNVLGLHPVAQATSRSPRPLQPVARPLPDRRRRRGSSSSQSPALGTRSARLAGRRHVLRASRRASATTA